MTKQSCQSNHAPPAITKSGCICGPTLSGGCNPPQCMGGEYNQTVKAKAFHQQALQADVIMLTCVQMGTIEDSNNNGGMGLPRGSCMVCLASTWFDF